MNEPSSEQRVSKSGWIAMAAIMVVLLLVAIYANWQHAHREKIECVTIIRFTPSPSPSVAP
jgi:hypothetical protein